MGKIILSYEGESANIVSTYGNRCYEDFVYLQQHLDQCYDRRPEIVTLEDIAENKELIGEKN